MTYTPHNYQRFAEAHILEKPYAGLFLSMGLGKTIITLSAIDKLIYQDLAVDKVLVIGPKKVIESTWSAEIETWDHLRHLRLSVVLGTEQQRIAALRRPADIYAINRENVAWLVSYYQSAFPFDMVVIDELSSFKNAASVRFKALRTVRPKIRRVVGLTGTPAPNGLEDLWPQIYLLDQGERLGKTLTGYRNQFFVPGRRNGHVVFDYKLRSKEGENEIMQRIGDICISMKAEDYLDMPKRIDRTVEVVLPDSLMKKYQDFERELVLSIEDAADISAVNAAALTGKLRQFASGAVYDADKSWHEVHTEKLEALAEEMEAAGDNPVLVFYQYRHDLERLQAHFKSYRPRVLQGDGDVKDWNAGKIRMLLAHPASAGHGLNLQQGGHLIEWFGVDWSLELYEQAVARLDRQGQTRPVINTRIITKGTIDEDVLAALADKATVQNAVMAAVKARIQKYK